MRTHLGLGLIVVACCCGCLPPEAAKPTPPPAPPAPVELETVKAEAGVGKQGQASKDLPEGFLVTPARALFRAKQQLVFDVAIPQAMGYFQAAEGRFPNSEEEFMEKIVQENNIHLPELPAGHVYKYDVEKHELMVERPKGFDAPKAPNP